MINHPAMNFYKPTDDLYSHTSEQPPIRNSHFLLAYQKSTSSPPTHTHRNIAIYEDPQNWLSSILAHILYNSERIGLTSTVLHQFKITCLVSVKNGTWEGLCTSRQHQIFSPWNLLSSSSSTFTSVVRTTFYMASVLIFPSSSSGAPHSYVILHSTFTCFLIL